MNPTRVSKSVSIKPLARILVYSGGKWNQIYLIRLNNPDNCFVEVWWKERRQYGNTCHGVYQVPIMYTTEENKVH